MPSSCLIVQAHLHLRTLRYICQRRSVEECTHNFQNLWNPLEPDSKKKNAWVKWWDLSWKLALHAYDFLSISVSHYDIISWTQQAPAVINLWFSNNCRRNGKYKQKNFFIESLLPPLSIMINWLFFFCISRKGEWVKTRQLAGFRSRWSQLTEPCLGRVV